MAGKEGNNKSKERYTAWPPNSVKRDGGGQGIIRLFLIFHDGGLL
jgi:hypothetical protein